MGLQAPSGVAAGPGFLGPGGLVGVAGGVVADGRRAEPNRSLERLALSGGQVG